MENITRLVDEAMARRNTADRLRLMLSAPHLEATLRRIRPLVSQRCLDLQRAALMIPDRQAEADQWLEAIILIELALKEAQPPQPLPDNLLTIPNGSVQ